MDEVRRLATGGDEIVGFSLDPQARSVWILHAMYERTDGDLGLSHDEVHRIELAAGTRNRTVIAGEDLDENTSVTGGDLGWTAHPGPGWQRLRWSELAERLNEPMLRPGHGPFYGCFPGARIDGSSWPASIQPPGEGSLDVESWRRLVAILQRHTDPGTECFAFYGLMATPDWKEPHLHRGSVAHLNDIERLDYGFSPSNLWPSSRNWFVHTDYDLWGTRVWGSEDLLEPLARDDRIEAYPANEIMTDP